VDSGLRERHRAHAPLGGFGAGTELLLRPAPTGQELRWKQATSYCDFSL
jgi:hypothetical protein